tara:strand:+ start:1109 stop:1345 length:237 start_codon:yes stop_codon:yes gene_type:complete
MSRRIKKLTPALLKRLIKEEKSKLAAQKRRSKKRRKSSVSKELKMLSESKKQQIKLVKKFREIHMLRQRLKKNLIKRL